MKPADSIEVRIAQLHANLQAVRARIQAAAQACGRDPDGVTLVAVTKNWPAEDVRHLAELGVTDFGENRDQEARAKAEACAGLGITWHFVGQLQTNKAASVARYANIVESVDRMSLVAALSRGAQRAQRVVGVCCQVDLGRAAGRGGVSPQGLLMLAHEVDEASGLELAGVMAVAPLGGDPGEAFERLVGCSGEITAQFPNATVISAGMSGDLEPAIAAGATHVRVGTALLGRRSMLE